MDTNSLYQLLDQLAVQYEKHEHVAVYTSEQARRLRPSLSGTSAKNLFLRNKKGNQYYLLVYPDKKSADLKSLAAKLGLTRLSLASPERLLEVLGIEPGAVSLLALVNDTDNKVKVLVDQDLWQEDYLQFHPLINTATLVISLNNIIKLLEATGHEVTLVEIPS